MQNLFYKPKILVFNIFISIFQAHANPVFLDDFTRITPPAINQNNKTLLIYPNNKFIDSNNQTIKVYRELKGFLDHNANNEFIFLDNSKFTLTKGKLNYNASKILINNDWRKQSLTNPNAISYTFPSANLATMPFLKFNFDNISHDFNGTIQIDPYWIQKNVDIQFDHQNPSTIIDFSHLNNQNQDNLSYVNTILFIANTGNIPDLTFDLTSIELVPEPFSTTALGTGMLHLIQKRKRKQNLYR